MCPKMDLEALLDLACRKSILSILMISSQTLLLENPTFQFTNPRPSVEPSQKWSCRELLPSFLGPYLGNYHSRKWVKLLQCVVLLCVTKLTFHHPHCLCLTFYIKCMQMSYQGNRNKPKGCIVRKTI